MLSSQFQYSNRRRRRAFLALVRRTIRCRIHKGRMSSPSRATATACPGSNEPKRQSKRAVSILNQMKTVNSTNSSAHTVKRTCSPISTSRIGRLPTTSPGKTSTRTFTRMTLSSRRRTCTQMASTPPAVKDVMPSPRTTHKRRMLACTSSATQPSRALNAARPKATCSRCNAVKRIRSSCSSRGLRKE